MSSATLYRASGLALILGAVLGSIGNILTAALFAGNDPHQYLTPLYTVVTLVSLIGEVLLLLGLPSICARQRERAGWLGFIGIILAFLGGSLFAGLSVTGLLFQPWLAQVAPQLAAGNGPPAFFVIFLVAGVLFALGGILLGIAVMRAGILPRWAGLLLLIGAVLNVVDVPLSDTLGAIVASVAFVLFAAGLGWMGYALTTESRVRIEAVQPIAAPAKIVG
ncbi:MAG: hypothetical protein M3Z08_01830 [Chloroflexota bacterium]|nr:hypothetical protein [Chloroflexota bacterium]